MNPMYDREHVESILKRIGMPREQRNDILDEIHFPVDLESLQNLLVPHGISRATLTDRMGGSP